MRVTEQLRTLEPFVPVYNLINAGVMAVNGQNQAAIAILKAIPADLRLNPNRNLALAQAYAAEGRYAEAADTLLAIRGESMSAENRSRAAARLPPHGARQPTGSPRALPVLRAI